jgi:putative spermidine/putrescine transport system permease protein
VAAVSRVSPEPSPLTRTVILVVVGAVFLVPIAAMVEFTLRAGPAGVYDLSHWTGILAPENARSYRGLFQGIGNSLLLAAVTVGIVLLVLLPTMLLVRLRFPRLERVLEFVCLIPITVPAIVLVVGLAPVYSVVARVFGSSAWTLAFAYGITVLPFAYRALHASMSGVALTTLAEAARSLGASWPVLVLRVLVPNLRRGILAASFIAIAVVLGEFTIASLLNRSNLQTALVQVQQTDPYVAVVFALLALGFAFVLLVIIGRAGARDTSRRTS